MHRINFSEYGTFYKKCQEELKAIIDQHKDLEELTVFMKKVKVNVIKGENNIHKLKYAPGCNFKNPWMIPCRGVIINNGKLIYAFNKFFNYNQFPTYFVNDEKLDFYEQIKGKELVLADKADGTFIHTYFIDKIYISTLGSIHTGAIQNERTSYKDKFITFLDIYYDNFIEISTKYKNYQFAFELIAKVDQKVSIYKREFIVLIAIINENGIPIIDEVIEKELKDKCKIDTIKRTIITENHNETITHMINTINEDQKECEYPEGFVLYIKEQNEIYPVMKLKTEEYKKRALEKVSTKKSIICDKYKKFKWESNFIFEIKEKEDDIEYAKHINKFNKFCNKVINRYNSILEECKIEDKSNKSDMRRYFAIETTKINLGKNKLGLVRGIMLALVSKYDGQIKLEELYELFRSKIKKEKTHLEEYQKEEDWFIMNEF
jgi:hypothetical protein